MNHNHNLQEDFADMRTIRFWAVPPLVRRSLGKIRTANCDVNAMIEQTLATFGGNILARHSPGMV